MAGLCTSPRSELAGSATTIGMGLNMNTFLGIATETWVTVDGDCEMATEVSPTEAQIELGHTTGSLHLVLSEAGIDKLIAVASAAWQEMDQAADRRP